MDGLVANILYEQLGDRVLLKAMPVMLGVLCVLAIAYRYYSAFLAAKVVALDDSRPTPAHEHYDGQNYHPTNRWVLFGHHFAAISGAGPLIGPVLAVQFGYFPGLLWLLIGVCLAGAVQDMLVLAASVRRGGKSLAEIARSELGPWASLVVSAAILFIVIIALAGLGIVVVKALGGEEVKLAGGMKIIPPDDKAITLNEEHASEETKLYDVPKGSTIVYLGGKTAKRPEALRIQISAQTALKPAVIGRAVTLPPGSKQIVAGSSWGTFTIACTIPIALFVGLYMYKIRKGAVVEASLLGAVGVIAATVLGSLIPDSALEPYFSLTKHQTIAAMVAYGFVASVLPVWLLLCPRDYLSSFLKIGTIALLVVGVIVANPTLKAPVFNDSFEGDGPTFKGDVFPFVFICIMCGAVSGFHALVSSGTTPKMINKERDIRPIGYGAMLMEGLVGVVALIAAASLPTRHYYAMNTSLEESQKYEQKVEELAKKLGETPAAQDRLGQAGQRDLAHLPVAERDLSEIEQLVGNESLRGRTGGAVTLAVGMALIFTEALDWTGWAIEEVMKYWYHFAIMFEALFILTTIDTGTRIARFLLQEAGGKIYKPFAQPDWLPGAILSSVIVTAGWGALIWDNSIDTIWPMFGIANQLLAVIALCLVTTLLINSGRARYAWVTLVPMAWVITTTMTAAYQLITIRFPTIIRLGLEKDDTKRVIAGYLNIGFTIFVVACVLTLLLMAVSRWLLALRQAPRSP